MGVEVGDTSAELVALEVPEWHASVMVKVFTLDNYSRVKAAASESGILNKHKLLRLLVVHGVVQPQISMEVVRRMRRSRLV